MTQTLTLSSNPRFHQPFLEVPRHTPKVFDEAHDSYDPSTLTTFARQRSPTVERPSTSADHQLRPPSASGSQRPLRRIPRQTEVRQSLRRESLRAPVPHPNRPQPPRTTPVSVQVQHAPFGSGDRRQRVYNRRPVPAPQHIILAAANHPSLDAHRVSNPFRPRGSYPWTAAALY